MKWTAWFLPKRPRKQASPLSPTQCPTCGDEMVMVERSSMSGDDMRTYRCRRCKKEHIRDFGVATWKILSDAREAEEKK